MRKLFFLLLLGAFLTGQSQPQAMWQIWHNGNVDRWAYSWGDEFDDEKIDESKWLDSYPWGRNYSGTCSQEYMTPDSNYEFENGILKLVAKQEEIFARGIPYKPDSAALQDGLPNLRTWNFTSGMIFSQEKFKHGMFEISCKLPKGTGFCPAFWLYAGGPNEEFDIFEFPGKKPRQIHYDMHCPDHCRGFGGNIFIKEDFSERFHTFMGQWDEDIAYWHLNGKSFAFWEGTLQNPANIIAHFGVTSKSCFFGPAPDETTLFPSFFEIDHIRVWKRVEEDDFAIVVEKKSEDIFNNFVISQEQLPSIKKGSMFYNKKGKLKNRRKIPMNNPAELFVRIFTTEKGTIILEFEGKTEQPIAVALLNSQNEVIFSTDEILGDKLEIDLSDLPAGDYILEGRFDENGRAQERIKLF